LRRVWTLLLIAGAAWALALLSRGAALGPDEIEFFRATRWTSLGLVPFRDFWEHHTPLQWLLFAPVAGVFGGSPGASSVIAMRWAQLPLWVAMLALIASLLRGRIASIAIALTLAILSPTFLRRAVEYRVDVVGSFFFIGAVALVSRRASSLRWVVFGVSMAAAVLANMRLAPVVVLAALLSLWWRADEEAWRWNPRALWMVPGAAGVALGFIGWLRMTAAWQPFLDGAIGYNTSSARLIEVHTFFDAFLLPLWALDITGIAFWIAAFTGCWLVVRDWPHAGSLQFITPIALASIVTVAAMEVHYDYHFQLSWLLMLPLASVALERIRKPLWQGVAIFVATVGLVVFVAQQLPQFGRELQYQNAVMSAADRFTRPGERVLDGTGYALRRTPAWRYWFLTTGVRLLAAERMIAPYSAAQMEANPPAAIIADYRLALYMEVVPEVARYAATHYVPLYRNLWLPGATIRLAPGTSRSAWIAPRAGRYAIWSSPALPRHPWFSDPIRYASTTGPHAAQYAIPLASLPPMPQGLLQWTVDGMRQPAGIRVLELKQGSRVELLAETPVAAGVLLVRDDLQVLAVGPPEEFLF
jgi:hypothetical protein